MVPLSTSTVIATIARPKHLRLAGLAVAAVALAGSAVYVTASAAGFNLGINGKPSTATTSTTAPWPDSAGGASAVCTDFETHFAADLGTSQTKVDAAFQKAIGETLADEVKNGTLTQTQADAIKKKLAGKAPCALPSGLGKPSATGAAYTQAMMTAAATALGITEAQLKTDLKGGETLSQIAGAEKPPLTEDQFRTKLIAAITPILDQAVTDKKMTSAQEQAIQKRLQTGPIPYWNKPKATN